MTALKTASAAALSATILSSPVFAEDAFPTQPVTIVVSWSAGGAVDLLARIVAPRLEEALGQPVVVENRPGATGTIGHASVARAEPDGHTLVLATNSTYAIAENFLTEMTYSHVDDLAPVAMVAMSPLLLTVNHQLDVDTVGELIAMAKDDPGGLAFSSGGTGTTSHLATELFMSMADVEMMHVPYQGGAPAGTAVASGEVEVAFLDLGAAMQFVNSGLVKPIAVGSRERSPKIEDVPTIAESELEDFLTTTTFALFAPAGTPEHVIGTLHGAVVDTMQDETVRERLELQGVQIAVSSPEELGEGVEAEIRQWRELVEERNIRPE